jgi:DNA-binding MarR family transcriptional regulator
VTHPLGYDPVEASRARWIEQGWQDTAPGMAAVVSIMRAEQIFLRRATDTLRPLGLTFARYQVLGMVRWVGPLTLGSIGHRLWITAATVTNAIDRLEAADLCRRASHPTDARATLVEITAKGRRVFDRAVERLNQDVFGTVGLSGDELDQLVALIGKIRTGEGDVVGG